MQGDCGVGDAFVLSGESCVPNADSFAINAR